jgi:hypothetical protein
MKNPGPGFPRAGVSKSPGDYSLVSPTISSTTTTE